MILKKAAEFGTLKDVYVFDRTTSLSRRLLGSPTKDYQRLHV